MNQNETAVNKPSEEAKESQRSSANASKNPIIPNYGDMMKKLGGKPQCYICKRMFTEKRSVITHIRTVHLELRPYKCTLCGHRAFTKRNLEIHINAHTKKRKIPNRKVKFFKYMKYKLIDLKNLI